MNTLLNKFMINLDFRNKMIALSSILGILFLLNFFLITNLETDFDEVSAFFSSIMNENIASLNNASSEVVVMNEN